MVLIKEFKKSNINDYEKMSSLTGSLRLVLQALQKGLIPHESYTEKDIVSLCKSLIKTQEANGSWPVNNSEFTISEEDETDFIFFPSQIACSILAHVKQNFSFFELDGIDDTLKRGLKFSVSKKLKGYGHNSVFQTLESLIIFFEGSVVELLNQDPRICPSLYDRLFELREEIQGIIDSGNTKMEFGGDYREHYEFVLKGLSQI